MDKKEQELLQDFYKHNPNARVLAFFIAGSHFFNLNGPNSDRDYRAIYMPSLKQLKEGKWPRQCCLNTNKTKNKNTKDDIDCTFFALDEYLKLLANGDFNMLELLYAPADKIIISSLEYEELVSRRHIFTPNDLSCFLGFVKKEYNRYGVDQSSFGKYQKFVEFLSTLPVGDKLSLHWDKVEEWNKKEKVGQCTTSLINRDSKRIPAFKIASRLLIGTNKVSNLKDSCEDVLSKFGHRQKAQAAAGVEFKGLYHAVRLLFEAKDLIEFGELRLPFDNFRHQTLKTIKDGNMEKEELFNLINSLLSEVHAYDESQRFNSEVLAQKHDQLLLWGSNYFYNKKQQELFKSIQKVIK